jgi:3-phenylpropionate/trans-cinnamate dioxygenase ferredoxin component
MPLFHLTAFENVPAGGMAAVTLNHRRIAVYRCDDQLYATDAVCTHDDADLTEGWLDTDDCSIECPLHGARFDVSTGAVLSLPAVKPLQVYPVTVTDGQIFIELPDVVQ